MPQFPYHFFEEFVVRTPLFSRKTFQETTGKNEIPDDKLKEICQNSVFQEAFYLASPYLYGAIRKWLHSEKEFHPKELEKLKHTLIKYYSRISTRCTPFGLFAGVGLGTMNDELKMTKDQQLKTDIHQPNTKNLLRDTRLDMLFLVGLSQHFLKSPKIRSQLLFFPNNSIYNVGNKIRYVEYEYSDGKRDYIISSAPRSEELQKILDVSKEGKTIVQIAEVLVDTETENLQITKEDAVEFVEELIDHQVLVSELEPNVSGNDFLNIIMTVLNRVEAKDEADVLLSIQRKLEELDLNIGNPVSIYTEIEDLIRSFKINYEQKYLFQTDLYNKSEFALETRWKKEIKKVASFLNKITISNKDTSISIFKKAFYERFETQEVPLALALDTEIGIGYRQDQTAKGIHPYLEDLKLPVSHKIQNLNIQLTPVHKILNEKLQEALLENQLIIKLNDEDFIDFEEQWNDLPDTISFMSEIISDNQQEKLYIGSGGGSSAANLLGRFCSEKSKVPHLTKAITRKEEILRAQHNSNEVIAEIIHLPEARIGNVIRRPTLRPYEIPYLAKSVLPKENQISVDDLYISLKDDKLILRSKRLNKEIKPYLTNAHNYYTHTLPIYHFLSDLHSQNTRTELYFDWGILNHIYQFLPRIEYQNIILSKARWKIAKKDVTSFESLINDKDYLLSAIKIWRNKRQIPQWIQWIKSDNILPLNLENYDMVKLFIQTVNIEKSIIIEEFLYNEHDDFKHEFIFSMYRSKL